MPLITWDRICRHKYRGGIGLRKTAAVNIAFQCKLAWKILTNKESMWAQSMRQKYLQQYDFFHYINRKGDYNVW